MKKGFTLLELLAVIAIMAIIMLIAIPIISNLVRDARVDAKKTSEKMIEKAANLYYSEGNILPINNNLSVKTNIGDLSKYIRPEVDFVTKNPCSGYVNATNFDGALDIKSYLSCDNYKTKGYIGKENFGFLKEIDDNEKIYLTDILKYNGETYAVGLSIDQASIVSAIILKLDKHGEITNRRIITDGTSSSFNSIIEVNGELYVSGSTSTNGMDYASYYTPSATLGGSVITLFKFDLNFQIIFGKTYGGTGYEDNTGIAHYNNELFMFGITDSNNGHFNGLRKGNYDGYMLKTDMSGQFISARTYGGIGYDYTNDYIMVDDGFYLLNQVNSNSGDWLGMRIGPLSIGVLKVDFAGNIQSKWMYGGNLEDMPLSFEKYGNRIFITGRSDSTTGHMASKNPGSKFSFIIEIDMLGNYIRTFSFGSAGVNDFHSPIYFMPIGNEYFGIFNSNGTGAHMTQNKGGWDTYFVRFNADTSIKAIDQLAGSKDEQLTQIISNDGNSLLAIMGSNSNDYDFLDPTTSIGKTYVTRYI